MAKDLFDFDVQVEEKKTDFSQQIELANVLCIRGQYERAIKIFNDILDVDYKCEEAYVGLLRAHSEDFSLFEGKEIEQDIKAIEKLFPDIMNKDYVQYISLRNKNLKKTPIKEEKPSPTKSKTIDNKPVNKKEPLVMDRLLPGVSNHISDLVDDGILEVLPGVSKYQLIRYINDDLDALYQECDESDYGIVESYYIFLNYYQNLESIKSKEVNDLVASGETDRNIATKHLLGSGDKYYSHLYYNYLLMKYATHLGVKAESMHDYLTYFGYANEIGILFEQDDGNFAKKYAKAHGETARVVFLVSLLKEARDIAHQAKTLYPNVMALPNVNAYANLEAVLNGDLEKLKKKFPSIVK